MNATERMNQESGVGMVNARPHPGPLPRGEGETK
jgi:hypothetical protein